MRSASVMTTPAKPLSEGGAGTLFFPRTELVDRLVKAAASQFLDGQLAHPFALLATGGYGRGELFPHSDVDLLLLVEHEPELQKLREPLSQFLRFLWDSSAQASHSVRTLDECCRLNTNNIHLSVSLLDARLVYGSSHLFEELERRLPEFLRRQARPLLAGLAALTLERHAKFANTVYHLEPNVKESPGGIRDVHFLEWAARLAPGKELLVHAASEVRAARTFLYRVRFFLHARYGRDSNMLSFELQDEAAENLSSEPESPEQWMRRYYQHARLCFQPTRQALEFLGRSETGLLRHLLDKRDRLSTTDFTVAQNRVLIRNAGVTLRSPEAAFELFVFVARHGIPLSWDAERRVRTHLSALGWQLATNGPTWDKWRELLSQRHAGLALRNMEECGFLSLLLPAWSLIDALVVRDFYHRYTVDEHTLVAIESVDRLLQKEIAGDARFSNLALEEDNLPLLRVALLLHDIGKGVTPGEHVRGSSETAEHWLHRIGMSELERATVHLLIENHLLLSQVMTGRDLDDPATAHYLSAHIPTYEDLRKLTLLTYADVSAVNPTAMTPWRSEQLWRVYSIGAAQLTRELASDRIHQGGISDMATDAGLARFLEGFPTRYLRIHSAERIAEHFQLEQVRMRKGVALELLSHPSAYSLTVLSSDQPGLFASLCGALASFGMNIVKAEAASNSSGCILDEFYFTDPTRTLELNPDENERLSWTVERVVRGKMEVADLLKRRRPAPRPRAAGIPPSLRFDNAASESSTLLHFTGEDRPGLLFDLASVLAESGCNIELVLVNTEAHRAFDVFYVTKGGMKLHPAFEDGLRQRLLTKA